MQNEKIIPPPGRGRLGGGSSFLDEPLPAPPLRGEGTSENYLFIKTKTTRILHVDF